MDSPNDTLQIDLGSHGQLGQARLRGELDDAQHQQEIQQAGARTGTVLDLPKPSTIPQVGCSYRFIRFEYL